MNTLVKIGCWLIWTLRLYTTWCRIFRFFADRKFKHLTSNIKEDTKDMKLTETVASLINYVEYRPDPWSDIFDTMRHPGWVERNRRIAVLKGKGKHADAFLDCDEFATWFVEAFQRYHAHHLSVIWRRNGIVTGHVISIWKDPQQFWYADVGGLRGPFVNLWALLTNIVGRDEILYIAVFDRRLRVLAHGTKPGGVQVKVWPL